MSSTTTAIVPTVASACRPLPRRSAANRWTRQPQRGNSTAATSSAASSTNTNAQHDNRPTSDTPPADAPVVLPDGGTHPDFAGPLIPRPGGFHVTVLTLPANFNPDSMFDTSDPVRAAEIAREQTASAVAIVPDPNPAASYGTIPGFTGLHATASIDCLMQLSGEAVFVLEDAEVRLAPGDWLIVNGVTHSWRNDRDEPAVMVGVVIGAEHKGVPLRKR
jgi:hypothetical protein